MSTALAVRPLAITGCGVISPAGLGLDRLGELLHTATPGNAELVGDDAADFPPRPVRAVPEFRLADHVGRKGTKNLDRMTALGLIATKLALEQAGTVLGDEDRDRTGVALGTSIGSIRSASEVSRDTLVQERPYQVNPSQFPNTVMNSCAGQLAIWNSLRGVNATLAGGQLSSLFAMRYARVAISQGNAARLVVGGIEELSPQYAWAWHRADALTPGAALGEGCAVFVVEDDSARSADRPVLAEVLACEVGFYGAGRRPGRTEGLALSVRRALDRSGITAEQIDVVSLGATSYTALRRVEQRALRSVLGVLPAQVSAHDVVGECYSASGAMQVAALLAHWQRIPASSPRTALVTSVGLDGNVGALVVREGRGGQPA